MRGRKPSLGNVVPMRNEASAAAEDARAAAVDRLIRQLQPKRINKELRNEWERVGRILADPAVDRLKPRFVDTIMEYCRVVLRLRHLRATFEKAAKRAAEKSGGKPDPIFDPLFAELIRTDSGRYGPQVRAHPFVAQINEEWRKWRSLVAMLGLSPADERNMLPGQGDLFDESEQYFA